MSNSDPESLEAMICGNEAASERDLQVLEDIALLLVENQPAENARLTGYELSDGGASVIFSGSTYDDIEAIESFVSVGLLREPGEHCFTIGFNPNNSISDVYLPDNESAVWEAREICKELLDADVLDRDSLAIVGHMNMLLETCFQGNITDQLDSLSRSSHTGQRHLADITRKIIDEQEGDRHVDIREYVASVSPTLQLTVIQQQPIGYSDDELREQASPQLTIILQDLETDLVYCYEKFTADRSLYVSRITDAYASSTDIDRTGVSFIDDLATKLCRNTPQKTQVSSMIEHLDKALMEEFGLTTDVEESYEENSYYPDMEFSFDTVKFLDKDGQISVQGATKQVINAINHACQYELPEDFADKPQYSATSNKRSRLDKFLQQRVKPSKGHAATRRSAIDVSLICNEVFEYIATKQNHPVAQALIRLYLDYGDIIGSDDFRLIQTEVIKITHTREVHSSCLEQSRIWRMGQAAVLV